MIFHDEVYVGDMVQGKKRYTAHKATPVKPDEWIIVRNTHEAIISRELFEQVQKVRDEMAHKYTCSTKRPYSENILKGKIFCGGCGGSLHRHRKNSSGEGFCYYCLTNYRTKKGACTAKVYITEARLFGIIIATIRQKAEVVMGKQFTLKQCDSKLAAQKAEADTEIRELARQTEKNRELLAGLYESFIKGILTKGEYFEFKESYSRKVYEAVERVQQLQSRQSELERQLAEYTSMAERLAAAATDSRFTAQLVDKLIQRVTVNGPEDVSVDFTFDSGFERVWEALGNE